MKIIEHGAGGGPEILRVTTIPAPVPAAGEVLIEVHYAGVNRPDVLQRSGNYPPPPGASPYLGLEVAGRVAALGDGVTAWKLGDEVCALTAGGGYAEYCTVDARHCLAVPKGLSLLQAAALPENYFTVWANLFDRAGVCEGQTVLIHGGSSGIGLTSVQLVTAFGAKAYVTAGSASKLDSCLKAGAVRGINYKTEDFAQVIAQETQGRGVDVILDMVGTPYIERNIASLALEGTLVQIAFLQGSRFDIDAMPIMLRRLTVTGSTLRARSAEQKQAIAQRLQANVWPLLEQGRCLPIINSVYPLDQAAAAHAEMEASTHIGKIMLAVKGDGHAAR